MLCAITNYKPNEPAEKQFMQLNTIHPDMPEPLKKHLRSLNEYAVNHNAELANAASQARSQEEQEDDTVLQWNNEKKFYEPVGVQAEENSEGPENGVLNYDPIDKKWVLV